MKEFGLKQVLLMKELQKKAWETKKEAEAAPAIPGFSGKTEKLRVQPVVAGLQRMDGGGDAGGEVRKQYYSIFFC